MKYKAAISLIFPLISMHACVLAQSPANDRLIGSWMGTVRMGNESPRLVFEITRDGYDNLKGSVGSPDKGIKGIPVNKISVAADSVTFEISAAAAVFTGTLAPDKQSIVGLWQEGDAKQMITLKLTSVEEIAKIALRKSIPYRLQFSDAHYNFYLEDQDSAVITDLERTLVSNYTALTTLMKTTFSEKIDVIIYPDIKAFHQAINLQNAPDWVVGAAGKNELKMVSPRNPGTVHTYESLIKAIVHELCHTIVMNMREQGRAGLPKWLDEGFASYYANQISKSDRETAFAHLSRGRIPTWENLNNAGTVQFGEMNGYLYSASIIDFLVSRKGYEGVRKLILNPPDFTNIFGMPAAEMENQWAEHLLNSQKTGH